ncbi:MAG: ABC transporter substrate-binding protein [Promethearchaeota archaeon]
MIPRSFYSSTSSDDPNLSQPVILRMGTLGLIISGNWDPAITDGYNILETYKKSCLEPLFWVPDDSIEPKSQLATSWEYEYWPENETNSIGFNNSGGVKAINITLRDGVQFHDGSNWNATVAKWNIDRLFVITGNLTGNANGIYDQRNAGGYWIDVNDVKPYFTPSWNLSEYDAPDTLIVDGTPVDYPDPSMYSYYYLTDPDGSDPVIANNSNPYGGWDPVSQYWIHYAPYDKFSLVRWVEVVEDLPSGGKIRVEFNNWNLFSVQELVWTPQISMQAYKDYNETGIYGYQNGNDMIGTGPYIFQIHDEISDYGYMTKNENYWNKTALEIEGWFDADLVYVCQFPPGDLGKEALNISLLRHDIDYAFDTPTIPIDYNAVMANPDINYIEYGVNDYITQITLNCINETWWTGEPSAHFSWVDINSMYPSCTADPAANGISRPLRKALNFALDYDTYIHTIMDNRVVRTGGMLGSESIYYNSTVPLANYNLTHAREILLNAEDDTYSLTDPVWAANADAHNYSKQLALRGLTDPTDSPANNLVWQNVGKGGNPLFVLNFYWDDAHQDLANMFELACNNLGGAIVQDADNKAPAGVTLWDHCISNYWVQTFDGVHSIWSAQAWVMDYHIPETIPEGWVEANYGDPNLGTWRAPTYTVSEKWPVWNFGFCYDTEVDYWLERIEYANQMEKLNWFSKIAEKEQTELYPMIYVSQGKEGRVLWNDWELNFNRGDLFFANFRYEAPEEPNPPGLFNLFENADDPDTNGVFDLIWTTSAGADNYSVWQSTYSGTKVIAHQNATSPYTVSGLENGEYTFVVIAYNESGFTLSNYINVTVQLSLQEEISGFNIVLISCTTFVTILIIIKRKEKKAK